LAHSTAAGRRRAPAAAVHHDDPYKRIEPADYLRALAGIDVGQRRLVRCPSPQHEDRTPSCSVGRDASEGFYCFGCQAGGGIYDLASLLLGGPTGPALRGAAFKAARALVAERLGPR